MTFATWIWNGFFHVEGTLTFCHRHCRDLFPPPGRRSAKHDLFRRPKDFFKKTAQVLSGSYQSANKTSTTVPVSVQNTIASVFSLAVESVTAVETWSPFRWIMAVWWLELDWHLDLKPQVNVYIIYLFVQHHLMSTHPKMQEARERLIWKGASRLPTSYWHGVPSSTPFPNSLAEIDSDTCCFSLYWLGSITL